MTRAIESLKKIPAKNEILHEHIVSTYFSQKTSKAKRTHLLNRSRIAFIASIAVAIAFLATTILLSFRNSYLRSMKDKTASYDAINIFDEGRLNKDIIKHSEFRGYAKGTSRLADNLIILNNPKKYNWANLSLDFRFPVDFSKRTLSVSIKGEVGGERATIVLRDANNRSCRLNDLSLSSNWKTKSLSLNDIREDIDLSRITQLRIECGYVGEAKMDLPIGFTIYIKNIKILKEA